MGEYGIAVSLSRLPWQGTIALTFIIFPMISSATFRQDRNETQRYIENTLRYALILICAVALPMSSRPDFIFDCLPGYHEGAVVLTYMAPAYVFFSIANIHNTILMSSGRAKNGVGTHGHYTRCDGAHVYVGSKRRQRCEHTSSTGRSNDTSFICLCVPSWRLTDSLNLWVLSCSRFLVSNHIDHGNSNTD